MDIDIQFEKEYNNLKSECMGKGLTMNEIITKLNEIEEKAEMILCDARETKAQMRMQSEEDKRSIDAEFDQMEREAIQQLEAKLREEAMEKVERLREKNAREAEEFDRVFAGQKEELAMQILERMTQ